MALNKFMHPRNIYRNPPDFAQMASLYSEFSEIVTKDITGKISVNFKDPRSLRVLTKCLLKADFNLNVEIPEDRLVPTLPLRLNYLLWIEDLLNSIKRKDNIVGIDIGTGACSIYPLLAAVRNKWCMVATDSDADSLNKAKINIETNKLQGFITLKHNETSSVIQHLLSSQNAVTYDFCMCNPPFYSNMEELCESRSVNRPPPKNAFTGSPQELITKGGELEFIRNLIMESKSYKNKILIYTTMVGHKYNLKELLLDLKAEGVQHTHTEFCQGRVTRWGVAWTYQEHNLYNLVPPRAKDRKKSTPIICPLTTLQGTANNLESAVSKLKSILNDLNISYKIINKRGTSLTFNMLAKENTWSNQRRKRRLQKRLDTEGSKKSKVEINSLNETKAVNEEYGKSTNCDNLSGEVAYDKSILAAASKNKEANVMLENTASEFEHELKSVTEEVAANPGLDVEITSNNGDNKHEVNWEIFSSFREGKATGSKDFGFENLAFNEGIDAQHKVNVTVTEPHIVQAYTKIFKKESNFILEMDFLNGTGGKESLHQIAQYIKNKWK